MRRIMEQGREAKGWTMTVDSWGDVGRVGLVALVGICGVLVVPVVILILDALVRAGR